jgi:predicted PP-loop superfamily ATPase
MVVPRVLAESLNNLVLEIRRDLGYDRGVPPRITQIVEHPDHSIHAILSDRAEKSLMIGPGGRIAAEITQRTHRVITFHAEDELLARRHRLELTLQRIEEVRDCLSSSQKDFIGFLYDQVKQEMEYPNLISSQVQSESYRVPVAVAYSGGPDSGATLRIIRQHFEPVIALTVDSGPMFIDRETKDAIQETCRSVGAKHLYISDEGRFKSIREKAENGRIHPCGPCHNFTMSLIREKTKENGLELLLTGEMLPTGRQSIEMRDGLLTVHFPAALSLSKYRTRKISTSDADQRSQTRYGCHFLSAQHLMGWKTIGPSIFRVLRELQGGVLTTGEALTFIKSINAPLLHAARLSLEKTDKATTSEQGE